MPVINARSVIDDSVADLPFGKRPSRTIIAFDLEKQLHFRPTFRESGGPVFQRNGPDTFLFGRVP